MSQRGVANVNNIPPPPGSVVALEGNDSVVVGPNGAGIIFTPAAWGGTTANSAANTESWYIYNCAKWIVDPTANRGTHTTISAAIASASAGDTIFIRPGVYTENPTLSSAINLAAFGGNGLDETVNITGTVTVSHSGVSSITGIFLNTNSANCLSVTGACALYLEQCYINASNNDGISINNSGCAVYFENCFSAVANTFRLFAITTTAGVEFQNCRLGSAGTTAASTITAGTVSFFNCNVGIGVTSSSTGRPLYYNCNIQPFTNTTACTLAGTSTTGIMSNCHIMTGTASCVSIGTGVTFTIVNCDLNSSNTDVITGAGTLNIGGCSFSGTSSTINVTTQIPVPIVTGTGTSGQVLTSNGSSALPTWQSISADGAITTIDGDSGSITPSSGTVTISGGTTGLTTSGSGATMDLTGTLGIANGGTDATSFTQSNGIVTYNGTRLVNYAGPQISSAGVMTNSAQPAFEAYKSSSSSNVTGDGTVYSVIFDTVVFDQASNYNNSSGTFTAPVTGIYHFNFNIYCTGAASLTDQGTFQLAAAGSSTRTFVTSPAVGSQGVSMGHTIKLTASDTVNFQVAYAGASKNVSVYGTSSPFYTYVSGYLIC